MISTHKKHLNPINGDLREEVMPGQDSRNTIVCGGNYVQFDETGEMSQIKKGF